MEHDQDDLNCNVQKFNAQDTANQISGHAVDQIMEPADNPVCYHQNCPVCGRNLRIRVRLLGRRVYCQHCGGGFVASDAAIGTGISPVAERPQSAIVDELIERAAVMLGQGGE
jgi:hypothetical protein